MVSVSEIYEGSVVSIQEEHIEIELNIENNTIPVIVKKELVPEELQQYGMPIYIELEQDLKYTFNRRYFCVTEEMQKENDEIERLVNEIFGD
jgi:hypothetical protein